MVRTWAIVFGVLVGAGVVRAADPPPNEKTGVKVGEMAPGFKLKDQTGVERDLSALLKNGPVALVFYRSAGW